MHSKIFTHAHENNNVHSNAVFEQIIFMHFYSEEYIHDNKYFHYKKLQNGLPSLTNAASLAQTYH